MNPLSPSLARQAAIMCCAAVVITFAPAHADEAASKDAAAALRRATEFFRKHVSAEGGYLWLYSDDLRFREGEVKATSTQVWVQPPGTPAVGGAFLHAWQATHDPYYLDAATETALALVRGQLVSGGWDYRIEFDPRLRPRYSYRVDGPEERGNNVTTLDDNTTQEAIRFLMRVDKAHNFKNQPIHEATLYALNCLLKAQYPNGAWAQRYSAFPEAKNHPVKKASFPTTWSRTWPGADYRGYYTFNDNSLADVIDILFEAAELYQDDRYRRAVDRAGDFILLAQLPEPQPGWAQQYDMNMQPAWARKFEPPAITGGESYRVLRTLLRLYRDTGDKKYLAPVPVALNYYRQVRSPDGKLARFIELQTNKPLYFTKDYKLTYSDDDLPTHYGFKISDWTERVGKEFADTVKRGPDKAKSTTAAPKKAEPPSKAAITQARNVIAALDARGAWVEDGKLRQPGDSGVSRIISTQTFIRNTAILAAVSGQRD